nr:sensor histidine kinase [Allomuricauda sp.]
MSFLLTFPTLSIGQLDLDNYATFKSAEALQDHKIIRIEEDPHGLIWIATSKSVFRFDGMELNEWFKGIFVEILKDSLHHKMTFVHRKGIYLYNYRSGKIDSINLGTINGKYDNILSATYKNGGNDTLLLGVNNGFLKFDVNTKKYAYTRVENSLNRATTFLSLTIDQDNDQVLWLGSRKAGLYRYDFGTDQYQQFLMTKARPSIQEESNTITEIVQSGRTLYLGTWHGGYLTFDTVTKEHQQFFVGPASDTNPRDHVFRIFKTNEEKLWISSTKGAILLNPEHNKVEYRATVNETLGIFESPPLILDSEKRLWMGRDNGLRVIDTLRSRIRTLKNPMHSGHDWNIPKTVTNHEKSNTIYFCVFGAKGLYAHHASNGTWKLITTDVPPLTGSFLGLKIIPRNDNLFILEESGLYVHTVGDEQMRKINIKNDGQLGKFVDATLFDDENILILTRANGVHRVNIVSGDVERYDAAIRRKFQQITRLRGDIVHKDSLGNVWMGWKDNLFAVTPGDSIVDFSTELGSGNGFGNVNHIYESGQYLYLSLTSGIFRIDKTVLPTIAVEKLNSHDSTFSLIDENGKLWWLLNNVYYSSQNAQESVTFDESDGLHHPGKYGYEHLGKMGRKIVVGSRGIYSFFEPDDIQKSTYLPKPYIKKITIDGREAQTNASFETIGHISLGPNESNLNVQFSAQAFSKPQDTRFRYKLSALDKDWQYAANTTRQVNYTNLKAKEYSFMLQASNDNINWSDPIILQVTNKMPFYQSNWFIALVAFLVMGILVGIHTNRMASLRFKSKVREERLSLERQALRAQMNPHFIFNALNSIQHLITEGNEEKSIRYLNRFSKLLRGVLENSRSPKTTLQKELEVIKNYLELEFLRLGEKFSCQLNVDISLKDEPIEIPALLFQPFIENAIHHGLAHKPEGGRLLVELYDREDHIFCVIEDNGVGRQRSKELMGWKRHKSEGINMVQKRLNMLSKPFRGTGIEIIDLFENGRPAGTRVELKIPISGENNHLYSR